MRAGLIEEFRLDDASNNPQRCWELWDLLLYDKVVSEPNITTFTRHDVVRRRDERRIRYARCGPGAIATEQMFRINAKIFVDATGDSRLGLEAAPRCARGVKPRSEFNESLAPEKADQETLGSSILFTSKLNRT